MCFIGATIIACQLATAPINVRAIPVTTSHSVATVVWNAQPDFGRQVAKRPAKVNKHPVLTCTLIGAGVGALWGGTSGARKVESSFGGVLIFGGIGAGVGALVGLIVTR
jgi:hypothetical protein